MKISRRLRGVAAGIAFAGVAASGVGACAPASNPGTTVTLTASSTCQVKATVWRTPTLHTRAVVLKTSDECGIGFTRGTGGPGEAYRNARVGGAFEFEGATLKVRQQYVPTCQVLASGQYSSFYAATSRSCWPVII